MIEKLMSIKKSLVYTRTGDKGETSLYGGKRIKKTQQRMIAIGTIDELNAILGVAVVKSSFKKIVEPIQNELFNIGAQLANPDQVGEVITMTAQKVIGLENQIDELDAKLPPLRNFILPGGSETGSLFHYARTVCRRAEREVLKLAQKEKVESELLRYLNRLSDLLFILARSENNDKNSEIIWKKP